MTKELFHQWLLKFNLAMHGRKVLLLLDNASSHFVSREYSNVRLHFLPPNMTSKIQPLDAGIIRSVKMRYRKQYVQWLLDSVEANRTEQKLSLIESICLIINAWKSVEETIISNCWIHAGIVPAPESAVLKALSDYKKTMDLDLSKLTTNIEALTLDVSVDDYIAVDDLEESEIHAPEHENEDTYAEENDANDDEEVDGTISSSQAMDAFLKLNSFLLQNCEQCHSEIKLLNNIGTKVRALTFSMKKQKSIVDFFNTGTGN